MLSGNKSANKREIKEKVVEIYYAFFRYEDPSLGNANFWDEFFLLKVNSNNLQHQISNMSGQQLVKLMPVFNMLFSRCVNTLQHQHPIRIHNALLTLASLVRGVVSRVTSGYDVINILIGFEQADVLMKRLVENLSKILTSTFEDHHHDQLKKTSLSFLLLLVTGKENINENTLLEYLMFNCLFESLISLICSSNKSAILANKATTLLTLLVQYQKNESVNPYVVKLSILDDELAFTGLAHIVSSNLIKCNQQYRQKTDEMESTGILASISNMVGNMFVGEETKAETFEANDSVLLTLYEALHLNRNFNTTLSHSHTEVSVLHPAESTNANEFGALANHITEPSNLLACFLEYCSIVSQNVKETSNFNSTKLCFIILTCIVEDQQANSLMHDANLNFKVTLHKISMRHRNPIDNNNNVSRPLICSLFDLMVEFIMSHLMKSFPMQLHMKCLGIIHRAVCYEKKCRLRLKYQWSLLWDALMHLLKYTVNNETYLLNQHNIFLLFNTCVTIMNLFITYGDAFLSEPSMYDTLYYEVIRNACIFENLQALCMRYTSKTDSPHKSMAGKVLTNLTNIQAIINHYSPKFASHASLLQVASLTNEEVLEVVRKNYDSLTLRMNDNIDTFCRHSQKPVEISSFLNIIVREIVKDVRTNTENELFKS